MENDVSTQPKDQEPSMEEILSSIRRIIADEETEESDSDESPRDDTSVLDNGEIGTLEVLEDDDGDDDAGDLVLTSVVSDDGDIVDLNSSSSTPAPLGIVGDLEDDEDDIVLDDIPSMHDLNDTNVSDLEPVQELSALPEIEEIHEITGPQADVQGLEPINTMPAKMMEDITIQEDEPAVSTKKAESEALLSTGTASTTTGAFAKLSKAFRPTPVEESVADGAGRTVEQFIEDMARPMLKEWLDENMPAIVERLVQKEIQKIARRAELL